MAENKENVSRKGSCVEKERTIDTILRHVGKKHGTQEKEKDK